jgi:hypothetical protein
MIHSRFFASLTAVLVCLLLAHASYASSTFTTTFTELNDSGVSGAGTVTLDGDMLTVHIVADGLEPDKFHQQHVHGFLNPNDKHSEIPTLAKWDKNHNGTIDDVEGDASMGNEMVYLTKSPDMKNIFDDFPVASSTGHEDFQLSIRGMELHGMTENGDYNPEFPVAAGLLRAVGTSSSGGNEGSGSASVPLPPASWTGFATLGLIGLAGFTRKARLA